MTIPIRSGLLAVSVLAAVLSALLFAGAAVRGEPTKSPLANVLSADELGKFTVVDMADALDHVTAPKR